MEPRESPFDPDLKLVVVLESDDPFAVAFAKSTLDEAGIPYYVLNEISRLVNDIDPMLHKLLRLQVAADHEAEARELVSALRHPESGA